MIDPIVRCTLEVQPFARGVVGAATREVAFLRLEDEWSGRVGFGECAPLHGLHRESLAEAIAALEDFIDGVRDLDELPPSAAFAASCAVATSEGLGGGLAPDVEVAAFFGQGVDALTDGELARLAGAGVVKLKVGRAAVEDDRRLIGRVLDALPAARLRIDGNRRLSRADCESMLRGFDAARFEYLEDPLAEPAELPALSRATGIAVALDETVVDRTAAARALREELARSGCVGAWVLRMSALGSLEAVYAAAADAARLSADAVLSTAYESSYTLRLAVHVAAAMPNARRAHGIGTAHMLLHDACMSAVVRDGRIAGEPLPVPIAEAWS